MCSGIDDLWYVGVFCRGEGDSGYEIRMGLYWF